MCSAVSKQLLIPPVSLNVQLEVLSSATTCERAKLLDKVTIKFVHQALESDIHVILLCNLIGGALSEPAEVNRLNPPMLPGSFLPHVERRNEPGDEVTQTQLEVEKLFGDFFHER